jgi:hypothetical protein
MKKLLIIIALLSSSIAYGQFDLECGSFYSPIDTIELSNFQSSFDFEYYYTAPNAGLEGGIYVLQYITISENSVIDTLILNPTHEQGRLITYAYPEQTYNIDIRYNSETIPDNYFVHAVYNIYGGSSIDTCPLNFVLKFKN